MPPETPATIYDKVAYPSYAHPQTHPDQLATKALLYGMSPAPIERCRVLELGCFNGTNLASIALGFPQCECIGIDLSAIAIAQGQEMTQAIGLKMFHFVLEASWILARTWASLITSLPTGCTRGFQNPYAKNNVHLPNPPCAPWCGLH